MAARADRIGAGWAKPLTMGAGQFCTNPGVLIAVRGNDLDSLQTAAVSALDEIDAQKMLTDAI